MGLKSHLGRALESLCNYRKTHDQDIHKNYINRVKVEDMQKFKIHNVPYLSKD